MRIAAMKGVRQHQPSFLRPWSLVCVGLMLLWGARSSHAACSDPSQVFGAAVLYPSPSAAYVVSADFDGDGIADLATSGHGNVVQIFLGNGTGGVGDGTFHAGPALSSGSEPFGLAVADINHDGIPDLVSANVGDNTASVFLGVGNGTFLAPTTWATGVNPIAVWAGDLNGDGRIDLITADLGGTVSVLMGQSGGSFAPAVHYPAGSGAAYFAVADFNGDGIADLAVPDHNASTMAVLLGHGSGGVGDGTFGPATFYTVGSFPHVVVARDLNSDGILDLVVSNDDATGTVAVLLGHGSGGVGDGTFQPPVTYTVGAGVRGIGIADFNGDGLLDLAFSEQGTNRAALMLGLGSGGLNNGAFATPAQFPIGSSPSGLITLDVNHDGKPDLVIAGFGSQLSVLLNGGCGVKGPPALLSVRDVPNDQGGHVFLRWTKSVFDTAGNSLQTTGYRVWRRLPPGAAQARLAGTGVGTAVRAIPRAPGGAGVAIDFWEALATLPAEGLAGYGNDAPTTQDSLPGSNPYTAFFVTALTADPTVFYESNVDSGYSVDNLAPPMPAPFTATYALSQNALHWGTNPAPDLLEFRLYRGTNQLFVPGPTNLVIATRDTGYTDTPGNYFYKLAAVDLHKNTSLFALVTPVSPVGALASVASVEEAADHIKVTWFSSNPGLAANVYRRTADGDWTALGSITGDASGYLNFTDRGVTEGTRYGYRLGIMNGGVEAFAGETWATAEVLAFALDGARPNPAVHGLLSVSFSLPSAEPARIEVFDITGRRVAGREVGSLGPGRHVVDLAQGGRIPAGLYVVRLSQGKQVRTVRAVALN